MKITAFTEGESGEPTTVDHGIDCIGADEDATTFGELVQDITNLSLDDIDVVSENVATIAIHALHGVLAATDPAVSEGEEQAHAWALAALKELAFYDVDGIEVEYPWPDNGPHTYGPGEGIAADQGREVAGKLFAGQTYEGAKPFVAWPEVAPHV